MIVGEIGINHQGSVQKAIDMIRMAAECGVDAVKFQTFKAEEICSPGIPFHYQSQGLDVIEDMYDMFKRHELPRGAWYELKQICESEGVEFMSTPMGIESLNLLLEVGVKRIKLASSDLTNAPLLEAVEKTGLPAILSLGMADGEDLIEARALFGTQRLTACICTSEYPTEACNVNISRMGTTQEIFYGCNDCSVKYGFSDHTIGNTAAIMAVANGATYFEKHITIDNFLPGPDHHFSANPEQLKSWVDAIKEAQLMVGSGRIEPTEQEKINRKVWRKTEENGYVRRLG